jgi:hypothetical protein
MIIVSASLLAPTPETRTFGIRREWATFTMSYYHAGGTSTSNSEEDNDGAAHGFKLYEVVWSW